MLNGMTIFFKRKIISLSARKAGRTLNHRRISVLIALTTIIGMRAAPRNERPVTRPGVDISVALSSLFLSLPRAAADILSLLRK